jgi:hypothetical protein
LPRARRRAGLSVGGWLMVAPLLTAPLPAAAQATMSVSVAETAGIRRTSFPAHARLEIADRALTDADAVQLVDASGADVPVQGTASSKWADGSVRDLEIDFNISLAPFESRELQLRYGADVAKPAGGGRGLLSVTEDASTIDVGRVHFSKSGSPLLASVAYRAELIVAGPNGVAVTDDSGRRHEPSEITWGAPQVLRSGPLNVLIRYEGKLALAGGSSDLALDVEMPNSKSWVKLTATASDPRHHVKAIAIETPISLGEYPWTWDFATPNGTYGAFRNDNSAAVFTRNRTAAGDGAWEVRAGAPGSEQPYEQSLPRWSGTLGGWTHLVGSSEAVAFAVEPGDRAGTFTTRVEGSGKTSFAFAPSAPAERTTLTLYQHYVSTPVPIGAATSPPSILNPLRVSVGTH